MAKFADKYDSPQDLEKGYRELDKMVSTEMGRPPLADSAVLVGDQGMFKTHEDLAGSYTKTATLHGKATAKPPATPPAPPAPGNPPKIGPSEPAPGGLQIGTRAIDPNEDVDADTIIDKAGLKKDDLVKQWDSSQKLTDEQYAAIAKVRPGLGKAIINQLARGMAAESAIKIQAHNSSLAEAQGVVGGEAQLKTLLTEADKFVPKDQQEGFNKMLADPRTRVAAVRTLSVMHAEAVKAGKSTALVNSSGSNGTATAGAIPTTRGELGKLMMGVERGDPQSVATLRAMTTEQIEKLQFA